MESTSYTQCQTHPSFLEQLRQRLVVVNPTNEKESRRKMELIIEHVSEFPTKLRPPILEASHMRQTDEPQFFLGKVYNATKIFFMGRSLEETGEFSVEWHGLDKDIDTQDQAELVIRCFPKILDEHLPGQADLYPRLPIPRYERYLYQVHFFLTCTQAIAFVPLLLKVGYEVGANHWSLFANRDNNVLTSASMNISRRLLVNNHYFGVLSKAVREQSPEKVDQESLMALIQMRDKGLVQERHIFSLIICLLTDAHHYQRRNESRLCKTAFLESRLRLLIGWEPSVLRGTSLLYHSHNHSRRCTNPSDRRRIFEVILELGMMQYPNELGFLYHTHKNVFELHCATFGTETVFEIVCDKISRVLEKSDGSAKITTLRDLVIAAATNEEISLDGLYTLLRYDPNTLVMLSIAAQK